MARSANTRQPILEHTASYKIILKWTQWTWKSNCNGSSHGRNDDNCNNNAHINWMRIPLRTKKDKKLTGVET